MGDLSTEEVAARVQQIVVWSRNLNPAERETLGIAVDELRRIEHHGNPSGVRPPRSGHGF
jgi:hypothetical protein